MESGGGVPEHLRAHFARYIKTEGTEGAPPVDPSGGSGQIASALWNQIEMFGRHVIPELRKRATAATATR